MRPANKTLEYDGETLTLSEWAERSTLPYSVIYARLRLGWEPERIFTTPPQTPKSVRVNGKEESIQSLSRRTGVHSATLYARSKRGVTGERLLTAEPSHRRNPYAGSPEFREWLFKFIVYYKALNDGISPSLKEMQEACQKTTDFRGVSIGSIKWALSELRTKGRILNIRNQPRCIQVVGGKWSYNE